jgi:hypothetical protein
MMRKRRVAHAVGLRRGDVGAVVGSGRVHRRLVAGRPVGLVDGCRRTLVAETRARLAGLGGAGVRRHLARGSTTRVGCKTALTLLDLALDAAAIRCLTDSRQDGAHDLNEMDAKSRRGKLERSLNDVVAIGITHKVFKLFNIEKLLDQELLGGHFGTADALLDDVGAELLLGKLDDLALETLAHGRGESRVVQIENVLDNVVAKGVLDQVEAMCGDLAYEVDLLEARRMVNAALENATAVTMGADDDAVLTYSIKDELGLDRL